VSIQEQTGYEEISSSCFREGQSYCYSFNQLDSIGGEPGPSAEDCYRNRQECEMGREFIQTHPTIVNVSTSCYREGHPPKDNN
jgi:hypothetical protein